MVTAYHARGYLGAQVTIGNAAFEGNRATLPVQIVEGPIFKVGAARVDDPGTPPQGVDLTSPIEPGTVLTDTLVRGASRQLQQRYRVAGYRGTRVTAQSTFRSDKVTADLVFKVARGERALLGTLTIAGVEGKERALVEHLSAFTLGEPVSLDAINQARDRLYDTDLFRQVSITPPRVRRRPAAAVGRDGRDDLRICCRNIACRIRLPAVRSVRPATSPKWGSVDPASSPTSRGGASSGAGLPGHRRPREPVRSRRARLPEQPPHLRQAVSDQLLRRRRVGTRDSEAGLHAEQRTKDFTFDQRIRFRSLQLAYGYNYQKQDLRITSDDPAVDPVQLKGNLSRLLGSFYYDRRDNVIDTGRGFFHSTSAEIAPSGLDRPRTTGST